MSEIAHLWEALSELLARPPEHRTVTTSEPPAPRDEVPATKMDGRGAPLA